LALGKTSIGLVEASRDACGGADEELERRLHDQGLEYHGEESPGMALALTIMAPLEQTRRFVKSDPL